MDQCVVFPLEVPNFILATSKGTTRLHRGDGCWQARGLTFNEYVIHEAMPESSAYTDFCKRCWRGDAPAPRPDEASDAEFSESSSSSTSSSS